jgi:hypothetical protein
MSTTHFHRWRFFSAGGFDQVQLETPEDLAALAGLDQKLWASLACPTQSLEIDQRLLHYIDSNKDGRIRAPDILAAIDWTLARLADPGLLFRDEPLTLAAFKDDAVGQHLALTARRLLDILGRDETQGLEAADTGDLSRLFPPNRANGDGLVPAALTQDATLKAAIADIIACMGAETDRSGEPAVSAAGINGFFKQAQAVYAWERRSIDASVQPFGELTDAAIAAISALREKVDDYFTRIELAAFDPRAASIMNGQESELVRLSALSLANAGEIASLPLAAIDTDDTLPLESGINPAWSRAMRALRGHVVKPVLGDVDSISKDQWDALTAKCNGYFEWQAAKPAAAILQALDAQRIVWLVEHGIQDKLLALVAKDKKVAQAADGLLELDKLLRFKQGLVTLLKNFVSFQDFYGRQDKAIFQAGTLYIDGKSCDLVVAVNDVEAHAKVAANSNSFLLYCSCTRRGQPVRGREALNIVAAVTAGSQGELMIGRNGLFYDRDGNDWDATVVKVVPNAISVREAFWSPYRRMAILISEQIQKLAAARDSELVSSAASTMESGTTAPAETTKAAKAFDIARFAGIFAAIGLAIGALGTALASVVVGLLSLQWWQWPLVAIGIIVFISGPSMLMAWFKLRRRNLGPILDANGWAVNSMARINIGFGASLTQLAQLPAGAARSLRDPYARERPLWPWLLALLAVAGLALYLWWFGWQ